MMSSRNNLQRPPRSILESRIQYMYAFPGSVQVTGRSATEAVLIPLCALLFSLSFFLSSGFISCGLVHSVMWTLADFRTCHVDRCSNAIVRFNHCLPPTDSESTWFTSVWPSWLRSITRAAPRPDASGYVAWRIRQRRYEWCAVNTSNYTSQKGQRTGRSMP